MSWLSGLLGLNDGVNQQQLNDSYNAYQNTAQAQQALLNALQAQNGLGNQTQVYNQLQGVVNGTGPNPAQAMLNQATGQNVANQAALMAGQRGASSNVGLMARQAAQQGANIQQQAVGQGATLQANQSLNALGQAGNMANTMASNQIGQTNANAAGALNEQQILQSANQAQNQTTGGIFGGLLGGAASAATAGLMKANGGVIEPASHAGRFFAHGGNVGDKMKSGGQVPGKPSISHNSYKNDTVKAMLTPGEVVMDLNTLKDKGEVGKAARFVAAAIAKRNKKLHV